MASVAEVRAAIEAAIQQVTESQVAISAANEKLSEAQMSLASAWDGSGHQATQAAYASLQQATVDLENCYTATLAAVEQAQTYTATL
ncbi:hypothetical protein [Catenuloplanes atrovinosus]|uniref:Uncharacterized protein YukE n=1 Tax=Catenuloplanes atrovinosus TaxID=137266 RepID=A0AAE3YJA3_9ACTN|nr:hypothetical protein [Catenuloplanes atrovinosus]MDR7274535.1 uncharacterized protein YukE [Catenuloplanes atrovinosus]